MKVEKIIKEKYAKTLSTNSLDIKGLYDYQKKFS